MFSIADLKRYFIGGNAFIGGDGNSWKGILSYEDYRDIVAQQDV
jgi:hypothetical protein